MIKLGGFAKYAWGLLTYNLFVILWGAYVRASGSGAGCGRHWPSCNGEIIPRPERIETMIEFTHRLSSGVALLGVVLLVILALRAYPKGSQVRLGAGLAMLFMVIEALVGAGLVLFQWVGEDTSASRAVVIAIHLANTFLLLASLALTAWWASGGQAVHIPRQGLLFWGLAAAMLALLLVGMSGAITALGDTLFPATSLREGIGQDFNPAAHFLLQLRVIHPILALVSGFYIFFLAGLLGLLHAESIVKRFAMLLGGLFVLQLIAGLINLALLAPIPMQLLHLLLADLVWVSLVLLSAAALAGGPMDAEDAVTSPVSLAEEMEFL